MESKTLFDSSTLKWCQIKCIENALYSVKTFELNLQKECQKQKKSPMTGQHLKKEKNQENLNILERAKTSYCNF
jgi:hypothetical protein